jgi:methyl-accepting chemotaxis protein WspA
MITEPHRVALAFFDVVERQLIPAVLNGEAQKAADVVAGPLERVYTEHSRIMEAAATQASSEYLAHEKVADALVRERTAELLIVAAAIAVMLVWLAFIITRSVTRRIATGVKAAEKIAGGDLTANIVVDAEDEAGMLLGALKRMTQSLSALIMRVKQSSVSLMSTATQISVTSKQQEATVNNLSASTAEIAAAVKEISATSQELRGTLLEINTAATRSSSLAEHGRTGLSEMDATMRQLSDSTTSISGKLNVIREKASDINGVVTTITKVADQTNLLSVNAAIEAEKAGEYGLGFLVVAREIRRLADQSAVATLDIEQMVRQMQTAVSAGVMEMDKFAEEVRRSARTVSEINGQLGQIIEEVQSLSHRIESVSEGMASQAQGAAQISDAMTQLTESARQTASSIKEFNTATSSLREAVSGLKEEIASFTVAS